MGRNLIEERLSKQNDNGSKLKKQIERQVKDNYQTSSLVGGSNKARRQGEIPALGDSDYQQSLKPMGHLNYQNKYASTKAQSQKRAAISGLNSKDVANTRTSTNLGQLGQSSIASASTKKSLAKESKTVASSGPQYVLDSSQLDF